MKIMRVKQPDGSYVDIPLGKGADGKTAYEYAVEGGYAGTELEFTQALGEIQEVIEQLDTKVPVTRTINNKPLTSDIELKPSDIGALPDDTPIPQFLSDLQADSGHKTVTDAEKNTWNAKSDFSGNYNDLTNKPDIPTIPENVSAFENDAGYLTTVTKKAIVDALNADPVTYWIVPSNVNEAKHSYYLGKFNNGAAVKFYDSNGYIYDLLEANDEELVFANTEGDTWFAHVLSKDNQWTTRQFTSFSGNYEDLANRPTSMPASDVYAWAKAATKPSYTPDEVGAAPAEHSHNYIPTAEKGAANGVAILDASGKVHSAQLPSYVDDVLEYNAQSSFPTAGESGKIYVDKTNNKTYRWGGSAYVEISASLALGETPSTAYPGDKGKSAYDHSKMQQGNPHKVSKTDVGLGNVDNVKQYSTTNPPPYPVTSVNDKTGVVELSADDVGAYTKKETDDVVNDLAESVGEVILGMIGDDIPDDGIIPTIRSIAADEAAQAVENRVPTTRKVNGKALNSDITLSASDVEALPNTTTLADLDGDATHRTVTDAEKNKWNARTSIPYDVATETIQLNYQSTYLKLTIDNLLDNSEYTFYPFELICESSDGMPLSALCTFTIESNDNVSMVVEQGSNSIVPNYYYNESGNTYLYFNCSGEYLQVYVRGLVEICTGATLEVVSELPEGATEIGIANYVIDTTLADYVKKTDYASDNVGGVVRVVGHSFGVSITEKGVLMTIEASNNEIDQKTNRYKPIVPSNLEYAVKSVTYDKSEIDGKFDALDIPEAADLTNYYTKSETYNKTEVNSVISSAVAGVDLSNYYTKSQTYNKTEINNAIAAAKADAKIDVVAEVGQTIIAKTVDADGKPTEWEAADYLDPEEILTGGKVILPETTAEIVPLDGDDGAFLPVFTPVAGSKYIVNYNGTNYICECVESDGIYAIGNLIIFNLPTGNDLPFIILSSPEDNMAIILIGDDLATVTVSITEGKKQIHESLLPILNITTLIPQTTFTGSYSNDFGAYIKGVSATDRVLSGTTYTVIFDGVEYVCTGKHATLGDMAGVYVGNGVLATGINTGEPFALLTADGTTGIGILCMDANEHTVEVAIKELKEQYTTKVFTAIYGVTTYQEIVDAVNAGRVVQVEFDSLIVPFLHMDDTACVFLATTVLDSIFLGVDSDNQWTQDIASRGLVGTTEEITPSQVAEAMASGRPVTLTHQDPTFGEVVGNSFSITYGVTVVCSCIIEHSGTYIAYELEGLLTNDTWSSNFTYVAETEEVAQALENKVSTTRKINGKALSSDITLTASDVGAAPTTHSHTKSEVGLSNVDNTSDANKPVSTAQQGAIDDAYDKIVSRGEQLVVNGNGLLGDNTNFSTWTFDGAVANNSAGSFTLPSGTKRNAYTDEFFPVNPTDEYVLNFDLMSKNGLGKMYSFISFYDADKNEINVKNHVHNAASATTLARDLKKGDTLVYLTDASGWSTTYGYGFYLAIWNYTNSYGYTYPPGTYTRNRLTLTKDSSNKLTNLDTTNKTVTLNSAYTGATIPAGTPISQGGDAATYKYIAAVNSTVPTTWATYSGKVGGVDLSGANVAGKFPPATAYAKVGFLWNNNSAADQIWLTNVSVTANSAKGAVSTIMKDNLGAGYALISNNSGKVAVSGVSSTELGYLKGVTSSVQTQLNKKLSSDGISHSYEPDSASVEVDLGGGLILSSSTEEGHIAIKGNGGTSTIGIDSTSIAGINYTDILTTSQKGTASGLAELDVNGKILVSQLPSYVDDVIEIIYDEMDGEFHIDEEGYPVVVGEAGKIYIETSTSKVYRWSGTQFVEISSTVALGETSSTAYRGDRGKIAYDHSQKTSGNPHGVTKANVGLGNVDNTSDANKPVSTAQATAILDAKTKDVSGNAFQRVYSSLIPYGTSIPANADLNTVTYMKVGNYYCSKNADAGTLTNSPTTYAFMMTVSSPLSTAIDNENKTWVYRLRKLQDYRGPEYVQYCYTNGTAGNWIYGPWYLSIKSNNTASTTSAGLMSAADKIKLDGYATVKQYGAKGDGTTDDTAAFNAALAAKRVVHVPGGTYKLSGTLTILQNCRLELEQDTVLNFTQTSGNCIEMKSSATLNGNHGILQVPYAFTGNVIYVGTTGDTTKDTPPYVHWDPQWKRARYIYDVNIIKPQSNGLCYSNDGKCSGNAIRMFCDGDNEVRFIWGALLSGIRIAGAFTYGIDIENVDLAGKEDSAWNHDMRIEAVIQGCETGASLKNCNFAHLAITVQPQTASANDAAYAKWGVRLDDCRGVDMMSSFVWDWQVARTDSIEYKRVALYGNCTGLILNEYLYWGDIDKNLSDVIYTNYANNWDKITILQEKLFKSKDNKPYFFDGSADIALTTKEELESHFITDVVPTFTNVLPLATDANGNIFNGTGWGNGYISQNGTWVDSDYYRGTGFIPVKDGDVLYFRNIDFDTAFAVGGDVYSKIAYYNANKVFQQFVHTTGWITNNDLYYGKYEKIDGGMKITLKHVSEFGSNVLLRFSCKYNDFGADPIISKTPIEYKSQGFLSDDIYFKSENLMLLSPSGKQFQLSVDENGNLKTTAV